MPPSAIKSPADDGPSETAVHIWAARPDRIPHGDSRHLLRSVLDAGETRRMNAFHFESDAHHYLVAHAMLRLTLAPLVGRDARDLRFVSGPSGKPALADPPPGSAIEFNLTHTEGLVACAVAQHPVGIDAESAKRGLDLGVAKRVLSSTELADLMAAPEGDRHRRFLLHWTLKEAYVKAHGSGLSVDLRSFGFTLREGQCPSFVAPPEDRPDRWAFMQTPDAFATGIPLAVAVKMASGSAPPSFQFHPFSPLT